MQLLQLILFGIILITPQNAFAQVELGHVELGCPIGSYRHGNLCYDVRADEEVTYNDAKWRCNSTGGSLAIIRDYETHAFLHRLRMRNFLHCYWFGLHDKEGEGDWILEDGTKPVYTNWAVGEPNNNGGVQDCASLLIHANLLWDDEFCYMNFLYICEFPEHKCTSKSNIFGKRCYEASHDFAPYNEADRKCKARGGHLALIKSKEIDTFIRSMIWNDTFWLTMSDDEIKDVYAGLALKFPWLEGSWIGIQYRNNEWIYDDNTTANFTRWSGVDPISSSYRRCATFGKSMNPYSCGIHYSYGKSDYTREQIENCYTYAEKWNKVACSDKQSYICQYYPAEMHTTEPIHVRTTEPIHVRTTEPIHVRTTEPIHVRTTEPLHAHKNKDTDKDEPSNNQAEKYEAQEGNGNTQGGIHLGIAPFVILLISCLLIGVLLTVVTYGAYLMKRNRTAGTDQSMRNLMLMSESNQE